MKNNKYLICT